MILFIDCRTSKCWYGSTANNYNQIKLSPDYDFNNICMFKDVVHCHEHAQKQCSNGKQICVSKFCDQSFTIVFIIMDISQGQLHHVRNLLQQLNIIKSTIPTMNQYYQHNSHYQIHQTDIEYWSKAQLYYIIPDYDQTIEKITKNPSPIQSLIFNLIELLLLIRIAMASIFHRFIEVSATKPIQANTFIEFTYMENEIRKAYKQVKNEKGAKKPNEDFVDFWKEISKEGKEEQIAVYFRWIEQLYRSLNKINRKDLPDREAQLYLRKSMIGTWDKRKVRLNGLTLQIFSKHLREYPLRCFSIRKSKNKQHFSWVMEVIMQLENTKFKSFHLGTNNISEFEEWYRDVETRIDIARIEYFTQAIGKNQPINMIPNQKLSLEKKKQNKIQVRPEQRSKMKTLTELVIDKQLKHIEEFQDLEAIEENQQSVLEKDVHPNIYSRIFPNRQLDNFTDNPPNGTLFQIEKQHRLYDVDGKIKIFVTISHNISAVFHAISESHRNWNPEVEVFTIKNKISSQNSILVYQKDRAKGFLYRERDYLFIRHCFCLQSEDQRKRVFMIEKSIDSIHTPPFMTVARGQKQLIWCVVGDPAQKECMLVVQGIIKGGGYMNASDNRQTTVKHFKKLLQLENYLKQKEYSKISQEVRIFNQNWVVNMKEENPNQEEQFYSPRSFQEDEQENQQQPGKKQQSPESARSSKITEQFNEFLRKTNQEGTEGMKEESLHGDLKSNFSLEDLNSEYKPPILNTDRMVVIPQDYLKFKHRIEPRPKGKEHLSPAIHGHHIWKGQWSVCEAGGLLFVDQAKMRQQKKVLTFIIKRIGRNILSGKGILNISLPVDIFCRDSNLERLTNTFGYFPVFFEKVANTQDPIVQLKAIVAAGVGSSLIYLTMEKPFNPIIGQTYQSWIDGCPVYFQQISHHPPIASFLMKGRGYDVSGSVESKMDLSINGGTGCNEGIFTVTFSNGRKFHFTTPPGELAGLTYGERKLCFVERTYFWNIEEGLFLEMTYNPLSKQRGFFGGGGKNLVGEERLADYFQGVIRRYRPEDLKQFLTPKKNDSRQLMTMPRSYPTSPILSEGQKVHGRWTQSVYCGEEKIFDVDRDLFAVGFDEKYPLPSHCNFREDIVYRRLNNIMLSQQFKEILEVKQRRDRKLVQDWKKKNR